jgi:exodeoxyribonuclease-5
MNAKMSLVTKSIQDQTDMSGPVSRLVDWIDDDRSKSIVLSGPAGSGKTTIVSKVSKLIAARKKIIMSAPTHKAVRVMKEMHDGSYLAAYKTTHSALGLVLERTTNGRKRLVEKDQHQRLGPGSILLIDEASMINGFMMNKALETGAKVLFVGDPFQFPPVKSKMSPVFSIKNQICLDRIIRQDTDELAGIVAMARDAVVNNDRSIANKLKDMLAKVGNPETNGRDSVVIAYTNDKVEQINNITGMTPKVGDTLIAMESFEVDEKDVYNSDLLTIAETLEPVVACDMKGTTVYTECGLCVRVPESYNMMAKVLDNLEAKAKHDKSFRNTIAVIESTYQPLRKANAITAHKSQGSTYDHVIVAIDDLMRCNDALRALYVAVSRARKTLAWC